MEIVWTVFEKCSLKGREKKRHDCISSRNFFRLPKRPSGFSRSRKGNELIDVQNRRLLRAQISKVAFGHKKGFSLLENSKKKSNRDLFVKKSHKAKKPTYSFVIQMNVKLLKRGHFERCSPFLDLGRITERPRQKRPFYTDMSATIQTA